MPQEDFDALLQSLSNDLPKQQQSGGKKKTGGKKNDGNLKPKVPVEVRYEGYTLRPVSPPRGERESWSRVTQTPMHFDDVKLYNMATRHRAKSGEDVAVVYRRLSDNQQKVIDRVIGEKNVQETHPDAIWLTFGIRRVEKDVKAGFFQVHRQLSAIELITCRKDKKSGAVAHGPDGNRTTTNTSKAFGKIIDLSDPVQQKIDVVKVAENKKPKPPVVPEDDPMLDDLFNNLPPPVQGDQQQAFRPPPPAPPPPPPPHPGAYPHDNYFWNGFFREEKTAENNWGQPADMQAPHPQPAQQVPNPFQPLYGHPDQWLDAPPQRQLYQNDFSPRKVSRSRSRSRPRRRYTASLSSSEADNLVYSDFTPPSTPPRDEYFPIGSLHRRRSQRYHKEMPRYVDERYEVRPYATYRQEERSHPHRSRRPVAVHADPIPHRITREPYYANEATFSNRRDNVDFLQERPRGRSQPQRFM